MDLLGVLGSGLAEELTRQPRPSWRPQAGRWCVGGGEVELTRKVSPVRAM